MNLVRIALAVPLHRYFDYLLPDDCFAQIGARVEVSFGSQRKIGVVVAFPTQTDIPQNKLKPILRLLDQHSLFAPPIWQLLTFAAKYYHAPFGEVLQSALPVKLRQGEEAKRATPNYFQLTERGENALQTNTLVRAKNQQALLLALSQFAKLFEKPTACNAAAWKALLEKGYIESVNTPFVAQTWQTTLGEKPLCNVKNRLILNKQQSLVVGRLVHQREFEAFLLNGVTGSGKTEVYLQVIEETLKRGKQVLVLVPEIGLTPQTIARFQARFNVEIDALHSNLNDTARLNVWLRAKNGESAMVIGTRSALFTQFADLGLIIIDEEHDSSFKQQDGWRYHARDLAIWRARNENLPIILGSATPSFESLQNAQNGKFTELKLTYRAGGAQFSGQQLIDLKTQRVEQGVSERLCAMMKKHLEQGNQVMLFLNRRGFSPVLLCHECGWICQCSACDKPFTFHQKMRALRCHHCNAQRAIPRQCAHCGSTHLVTTGVGTEQLEAVLSARFPEYKISRIDRDSTARKGALEAHLHNIQQGKSQILIGTQMLAKGHHFPNVTLVALVNVDSGLFSTDFRAEERLAQLYLQVAGRAGRAEKRGEVVLQTHYPDHPLLQTLLNEGYEAFAKSALQLRQLMQLPPFSSQVLFRASGTDNEKIAKFLENLTACLQQIAAENGESFQFLGPFSAPMAKKAGQYRWLLLVQHVSRAKLQFLLDQFDLVRAHFENAGVRFSVDVDPLELS